MAGGSPGIPFAVHGVVVSEIGEVDGRFQDMRFIAVQPRERGVDLREYAAGLCGSVGFCVVGNLTTEVNDAVMDVASL